MAVLCLWMCFSNCKSLLLRKNIHPTPPPLHVYLFWGATRSLFILINKIIRQYPTRSRDELLKKWVYTYRTWLVNSLSVFYRILQMLKMLNSLRRHVEWRPHPLQNVHQLKLLIEKWRMLPYKFIVNGNRLYYRISYYYWNLSHLGNRSLSAIISHTSPPFLSKNPLLCIHICACTCFTHQSDV